METDAVMRILGTVFAAFFWSYFFCATLRERWSKKAAFWGIFGIIVLIDLPFCTIYYEQFFLKAIFTTLVDLIGLRIFFKDSVLRLVFIKTLHIFFINFLEILLAIMGELLFHVPLVEISMDPKKRIVFDFFMIPFTVLLFVFSPKLINKINYQSISLSHALRFGFFPISQTVILVYLGFLIFFKTFSIYSPYLFGFILCIVLSIVADILLFRTVKDVAQKTQMETQNMYLRQQKELQLQHYHAFIEQQENIRKLRHDIMNHVQTIKLLIAENEMAEADEYTNKLAERFQKVTTLDYCDNKVIDAVLHNKMEYAQSLQIEGSVKLVVPETSTIDDIDLMAVFSNLLDNAIDAAAKAREEKAFSVSSIVKSGFLIIKVDNSGDGSAIEQAQPISTAKNHGFGLNIIREITEKYDGTFEIIQDHTCYTTIITLRCE